jgi:hypothetical protein
VRTPVSITLNCRSVSESALVKKSITLYVPAPLA